MTEQLAYNIAEACAVAGIRRTTLYKAIWSGKLRAIKIGRRTLFLRDDICRWLEGMPAVAPHRAPTETASEPSVIVHEPSEAIRPPDG